MLSNNDPEDVIADFAEFSGLPVYEIFYNISNFQELAKKEWNAIPAADFGEKAERFYKTSGNYIYDLLSVGYSQRAVIDKLNAFNPRILESIKKHSGKKFLDFGGGLGNVCIIASRIGKEVFYLDIPGKIFDFAVWKFKKYKFPISAIKSDPVKLALSQNFDIIFSDAVLEHVIHPEETIDHLCGKINSGGLFILLVDLSGHTEGTPMHRDINIRGIHDIFRKNKFVNEYGENGFCSAWRKS